jgi:hypothetical protein
MINPSVCPVTTVERIEYGRLTDPKKPTEKNDGQKHKILLFRTKANNNIKKKNLVTIPVSTSIVN